MGGFTLAGNTYVFISNITNDICLCYGLYGFINETDETDEKIFLRIKL